MDFSFLLMAAQGLLPVAGAFVALGTLAILPLVARWSVRKLLAMFSPSEEWQLMPIDKDYSYAFPTHVDEADDNVVEYEDASDAWSNDGLVLESDDDEERRLEMLAYR